MIHTALVIDDDPAIRDAVADILDSLGHTYDLAASQDEARRLLEKKAYSYILLDLEIPVRPGRGMPRIQNGENLLVEIRRQRGGGHAPVIVMTGHGLDCPDLAIRVMKNGATDYIKKPFPSTGNTLDRAIRDALRCKEPLQTGHDEDGKVDGKPTPFSGGEMAFFADRVELCGVVVLRGESLMRRVLEALRVRQSNGKYVAIGGASLARKLDNLRGQNAIAEAVKDFRDGVTAALGDRGIACGRQDVVLSGGPGYRLSERIVVVDRQPSPRPRVANL